MVYKHLFLYLYDFWYVNNLCVNTVCQHFPWSILNLVRCFTVYERESNFSQKWQPCLAELWKIFSAILLYFHSSIVQAELFITHQKVEIWRHCNTLTIFIMIGWGFCDIWNSQGQDNVISRDWLIVTLPRPLLRISQKPNLLLVLLYR